MTEALQRMRERTAGSWAKKTYKREVAAAMLFVWLVCSVFLLIFAALDRMNASFAIYSVMTGAIHTFALGAYGFDAWDKRLSRSTTPAATSPAPVVVPVQAGATR